MTNQLSTLRRDDRKAVCALLRRQNARNFVAMLILSNAWIASSFWTFTGFVMTAEETATADFAGTVHALIAAIVSAVVVAGCCAQLLAFSGETSEEDQLHA